MLKNLQISNVALIDNLSIDFSSNLNVLSGETGAGKSIVIDSLNFVIGSKTPKSLIKQDKDFMKVQALFMGDFSDQLKSLLTALDIDCDDEILLFRKLSIDGKNDCKINGTTVTLSMLKSVSSLLIDIHGQHEHQALLKDKLHLSIIDGFVKEKYLFEDYSKKLEELRKINSNIKLLNGSTQNQERLLDLLDYQINEIEKAKIKPQEDEILSQKKIIMQNAEKIFDSLESCYQNLDGQIINNLKNASNLLKGISKYDESLNNLSERIDNAKFELIDVLENIKDKKQDCNFDKYEYEEIDQRLDLIKTIKKKYGPTLEDVFAFLEKAKTDYDNILNGKDKLIKLLKQKEDILGQVYDQASKISIIRREVAKDFETNVKLELNDLGMKNSKFVVDFSNVPNKTDVENFITSTGFDQVKFLFSANAGQNLKPLAEIISGGEASRFMLALKNILASCDNISSMVFDEIDTGISGEMGYKVACKMANISSKHQVLAVSHLPQICAMADNNIKVVKISDSSQTKVEIQNLYNEELLNEISRLSGGLKDNTASLQHAKELKQRCNDFKKSIR